MSLFNPTPERAAELVAAANERAEALAVRIVRAREYAQSKGDRQLLALLEPTSIRSDTPEEA